MSDSPAAIPVPTAPPAGASGPVHAAIARAAAATGVDFSYLLAQARLESGLDPAARARTSSASGLYQFTGSTWLTMLGRHGAELGLDAGAAARDPAARAQLLALRNDPQVSALMAGELANDNRAFLGSALGRDPDNAELYLAHFLGPDGASQFLSALSADPGQSAAALFPKAAAANHAIFFAGSTARSVGQIMDLLRTRLDAAMGRTDPAEPGMSFAAMVAPAPAPVRSGGPIAQEFAATAAAAGASLPAGSASMADTLQAAFAMTDGGTASMPATVRAAYGAMRALGF